jgi:hypothetical protein
MSDDDP